MRLWNCDAAAGRPMHKTPHPGSTGVGTPNDTSAVASFRPPPRLLRATGYGVASDELAGPVECRVVTFDTFWPSVGPLQRPTSAEQSLRSSNESPKRPGISIPAEW